MARLPLRTTVVKRLFACSGNQCAFPNCTEDLIDSNGVVLGEICHIEAAEKLGERFNNSSNDEYRRSYANLLLLCGKHHKITNNVKKYPTTVMKKMKASHEKKQAKSKSNITDRQVDELIKQNLHQANVNSGSGAQINNQADTQHIQNQVGVQINTFPSPSTSATLEGFRKVNPEFKREIQLLRQNASPPTETVIDFKSNLLDKRSSDISSIPFRLLKFRKENGRIKAEVDSYEKMNGPIDESTPAGQRKLAEFLRDIDKDKNESLKQQIRHKTQLQPAIVTCDGFLINGNRRRLIIEELFIESNEDPRFENMRVVVLPDNVTEIDILKIENRYQLQDEGKSEYHGLNRALTIRDNEMANYKLEAQIRDDPRYHDLVGREFERVVKQFRSDYLLPLECVDRYLKLFNKQGIYNTISESVGDREGRWQAFIDYSSFYHSTLLNPRARLALGIKETEILKIEDALFKLIRKRNLSFKDSDISFGKLHMFLRGGNLKKYLSNEAAKKSLLAIATNVPEDVPSKDRKDKEGTVYTHRKLDEIWGAQNEKILLTPLSIAYKAVHEKEESDKPVKLIEAAYKKLTHKGFSVEKIETLVEVKKALSLTNLISKKATVLKRDLTRRQKKLK